MSLYVTPYRVYRSRDAQNRSKVDSEVHVPMDVRREENSYLMELIVPGLDAEDLEIEIVEKTIIISGEFSRADEEGEYLRKERPTGKFRRVIRLPKLLNMDKSEANLEKGILRLRVPVAEEALPRTIKVKAK